jgi:DUF438 domain-containing protein
MIRLRRNKNVPAGYMGSFQAKLLRKKDIIIPKEPHQHLSRFKTITITYELETETTPDMLLGVLSMNNFLMVLKYLPYTLVIPEIP